MITYVLTLIWVMPGLADIKPEIVQYDVQLPAMEDCLKAGHERAQELWDKHEHTGSIRLLCFEKHAP
jgi:hypothetical protein